MATTLLDKINIDLKNAVLAGDSTRVSTLRFLLSSLHNAKIERGEELADSEILAEIAKDAKRHRESIEAFEKGNRADLTAKEKKELAILEEYLPEQMSQKQIEMIVDGAIKEIGASETADIGRVMQAVMSKVKGQIGGQVVSEIVKAKLSGN